ncbi:hypothetical protein I7I51_01673 [Histoplasma capsulatum]|uniref:Uncharacterized protein n=1 Tax=Ajellomyces capsulatus TaxID=5037 RepID=A0A8A1MFB6_AJECA|nr:hypothetical protein I7I51_01673 [Histoplasma capsulatum]
MAKTLRWVYQPDLIDWLYTESTEQQGLFGQVSAYKSVQGRPGPSRAVQPGTVRTYTALDGVTEQEQIPHARQTFHHNFRSSAQVSNAFLKPPARNPKKTLELTRHPTPVEFRFPRVSSLPTEASFLARDPPTSRGKKASCPYILNGQLVCASCFANVLRHILKPEHTSLRTSFHSSSEASQDKPLQLCLYAEYSTTRP